MTDQPKLDPKELTPKLQKIRENLDRMLRDYDLSQQEYNSLMDDLKKRRKRIEGEGDSVFDDLTEE